MPFIEEAKKAVGGIAALGARRILVFVGAGLFLASAILGAAYYLNRPQFETLYAGLDAQDSNRIAAALHELNINFDTSTDGGVIYVENGAGAKTRMVLAERGLPKASSAGYELFDKLGSLGLTSFMQEITKNRAIEGELTRSILTLEGVRTARVHLAAVEDGLLRNRRQAPSASVVIALSGGDDPTIARAIRHLVAAAVPGMTTEAVTVVSADGSVMTSGGEESAFGAANSAGVEKSVSDSLQANIRRTLTPMLGVHHFNVSVVARINTDVRQTNETIYNPDGKVERSVRIVKENQASQNATSQQATSVERNIPSDRVGGEGKSSKEDNQKKEETTNYEVSSKSTATKSGGYAIEKMSVAIVVDHAALTGSDGKQIDESARSKKLKEIEEIAALAAGFSKERGDQIKVVASDFVAIDEPQANSGVGFVELIARQAGSIFNGLALIAVAGLVTLFGFRPVANQLIARSLETRVLEETGHTQSALEAPKPAQDVEMEPAPALGGRRLGQKRLEHIVEQDEAQVAAIIKQWVRDGEGG